MSTGRPTALALALTALAGCAGLSRPVQEPTVLIEGPGGTELGVSTDYGILFLGRANRSGRIAVTAWFGDGPDIETTIVEPVAGGVYTAETEILLPEIPLTFVRPEEGARVLILGRRADGAWTADARIARDPRVESGLLLAGVSPPLDADATGAPVVLRDERGRWRCLGVVAGLVELEGAGGSARYLTVAGPETTWRLVAHRRTVEDRKPPVYREDVR